jgi:hypothetical protein
MAETCDQMGSFEDCLPQCERIIDISDPPYNVSYGDITVQKGDSVQCRLFHVSAATINEVLHCPHAAGQAPCAGPLDLTE